MRVGFKTTIDDELLRKLKIDAVNHGVRVNDILEPLIEKYLTGEVKIVIQKER